MPLWFDHKRMFLQKEIVFPDDQLNHILIRIRLANLVICLLLSIKHRKQHFTPVAKKKNKYFSHNYNYLVIIIKNNNQNNNNKK